MSENKVLSLINKMEKGEKIDLSDDEAHENGRAEIASIKNLDGTYQLITYSQAAVTILRKTHKFVYVPKAKRYECVSENVPKHDDIEVVPFLPAKQPTKFQIKKIVLMLEAVRAFEKAIDKQLIRLEAAKRKLKNLLLQYGVRTKPGLSSDAFIIDEDNNKIHAIISTHQHFDSPEIVRLAERNANLKKCITYEPVVDRSKLLAIWDQLTPAVQHRILNLSISDSGVHVNHLKGNVCPICGKKLTKNAKSAESTCKICEG